MLIVLMMYTIGKYIPKQNLGTTKQGCDFCLHLNACEVCDRKGLWVSTNKLCIFPYNHILILFLFFKFVFGM